jgi:hypothetical protein
MVCWTPQFQTALHLTVSSRMPGTPKELKAKQGRTVMTRISLCAFWNPFSDLGREKSHDTMLRHQNHFCSSSETVCPTFQQVKCKCSWKLCRLSRSLVSGGSWPCPKLCIDATTSLLLLASSQLKEKVVSANLHLCCWEGHLTLNSTLMVTGHKATWCVFHSELL